MVSPERRLIGQGIIEVVDDDSEDDDEYVELPDDDFQRLTAGWPRHKR